MKRTDFKKKSSVFFIGKWVIFIGIIITASLSFILGFFVGKSYQPAVEKQAMVTPSQEVAVQKITGTEQKESLVKQPQQEMQTLLTAQPSQETKQTADTQKTKATQNSQTARKYTIQIGAFKNSADAKALKAKFEKKGYKTFVITTTTIKREKLYKVLVGEFNTREEAELLSIKIKNAERLKTFVTYKTNEEVIR